MSELFFIHRERGVALFSVLLLLVMVMVMIASISVATRQTLRQDALMRSLPKTDDVLDLHAYALVQGLNQYHEPIYHLPRLSNPPNLGVDVTLHDEMSKFNINALHPDYVHHQVARLVFVRLLMHLNVSKVQADVLADEVIDYLDADHARADGSLERVQARLNNPNTPMYYANAPMQRVDELIYLPSMRTEILMRLKPYVSAHPIVNERDGTININTADAVLLSALTGQTISQQQVDERNKQRQAGKIKNIEDFWRKPPFNRYQSADGLNIKALTSAQSHAIGLTLHMRVDEHNRRIFYLLMDAATEGDAANQATHRFLVVQRRSTAAFAH